jgi:hypothetical protein
MNLSTAVQQLEISISDCKAICQVLDIAVADNSISNESFLKVKVFIAACKEKSMSIAEGIQELLNVKSEAQTQQQVMGDRFNLNEFFQQRIGVDPRQLNPGSYHFDLYQLLLKSESISQVGYALFREAFLRQTQDLIMHGVGESEIHQNQTVGGFDNVFGDIEAEFERNFLGTSVNWGKGEHPMLAASKQASLASAEKTNISQSPLQKK